MSDADAPARPAPAEREDQPLQFNDRRTAVAFLVGILLLALIGVAGGALLRDSCDELFTVGERRTFVQPDPEQVVPGAAASQLLDYGDQVGLGAWRGAVALDPDTRVVEAPDGFLVFTSGGVDALEPGLGAVNASRGSAGGSVRPAFRGAAVIADDQAVPYEVAVFDEDLALIGCGEIVQGQQLLDLDRVRALHADGTSLRAIGLDGEEDWSRELGSTVVAARILLGSALVSSAEAVELVAVGDGSTIHRWELTGPLVLADSPREAIVRTDGEIVRLTFEDGGMRPLELDPRQGVTILGDEVIAGADLPALPGGLRVADVFSTDGAYSGMLVEDADERRWLLLYGPAPHLAEAEDG